MRQLPSAKVCFLGGAREVRGTEAQWGTSREPEDHRAAGHWIVSTRGAWESKWLKSRYKRQRPGRGIARSAKLRHAVRKV